jgi:hypothetical protein
LGLSAALGGERGSAEGDGAANSAIQLQFAAIADGCADLLEVFRR